MSSVGTARSTEPGLGRLGLVGRARLVCEILRTYPSALKLVRSNDLERMVAAARDVEPREQAHVPGELEHELALRLGVAVTRTLRVVPTDSRCLVRSVVLTRLLATRAIDSQLVIGVDSGDSFEAHAWVEHEQRPVLPPRNFKRLTQL